MMSNRSGGAASKAHWAAGDQGGTILCRDLVGRQSVKAYQAPQAVVCALINQAKNLPDEL
jgi:hypothetical protein